MQIGGIQTVTNEEFSKELSKIPNGVFNKIREEAIHEYLMQIDYAALKLMREHPRIYTFDRALLEIVCRELKEHGYSLKRIAEMNK